MTNDNNANLNEGKDKAGGGPPMCPDYLTFSCPADGGHGVMYWQDKLGVRWSPDRGRNGYPNGIKSGGIRILYGGRENMGLCVIVTGAGCRELESAGRLAQYGTMDDASHENGWRGFLADCIQNGTRLSRLDIALDDYSGSGLLTRAISAFNNGAAVTRFKRGDTVQPTNPATGEVIGRGLNFGKRGSGAYIRLYDKALQQGVQTPWERVEIETRKQRAQRLAEQIVTHGFGVVPGIVLGYVDFKVPEESERRDRWKTAPWWNEFLHTSRRTSLNVPKPETTLDQKRRWLMTQVAGVYLLVHEVDGDRLHSEMLRVGRAQNARHYEPN